MMALLAALAAGYLVGSIPTAAWLARARGKDVFALGSGNMGAMNMARNLSLASGLVVLVLDVAKGALATYLGMLVAAASGAGLAEEGSGPAVAGVPLALAPPLAAGFGAVLGHAYSMFVRFRGGKGLATTLGVSLPLYPQVGLAGLVLILAAYLITRRVGVAAVVTILAYPALAMLTLDRLGWERDATFAVVTGVLPIAVVVLLKHLAAWRQNGRLAAGVVTGDGVDPRRRPR